MSRNAKVTAVNSGCFFDLYRAILKDFYIEWSKFATAAKGRFIRFFGIQKSLAQQKPPAVQMITRGDAEFIEHLMSDREAFDAFVYTPWRDALRELEERDRNPVISQFLQKNLPSKTPRRLSEGKNMALSRHLGTPNYEMYRFMHFSDVLTNLSPIILEYRNDKYVNANHTKYALAELCFYGGIHGLTRRAILDRVSVINKNESNGKRISDIKTKWGESLISFHRAFLISKFPAIEKGVVDLSEMYAELGGKARDYYNGYLSLFLRNNILFENFLFSKEESSFMKTIILPTILRILKETGKKPLIINLGPTGNEEDVFWTSYPRSDKEFVNKFLQPK